MSIIRYIIESSFQMATIGAIFGGIIFLIAVFGFCGAIKKNISMLVIYIIFMLLLMVLKIALATTIFVKMEDIIIDTPRWLDEVFQYQTVFNDIEDTFSCCGTAGPMSYARVQLPQSCCASQPCTILNAYPGCNYVVPAILDTIGLTVVIFAVAIAVVELIAVVVALCFAKHSRRKNKRPHRYTGSVHKQSHGAYSYLTPFTEKNSTHYY